MKKILTEAIEDDTYNEEDFPDTSFSLIHLGNNQWILLDSDNRAFCGVHGWVHTNSSYYDSFPECIEKLFTFEELKKFVLNNFDTNLF